MPHRTHAFSLIELLIVLALVTCGYAYTFGLHTAWSQSRTKVQCAEHLRQMHAALTLFAAEHEGAFPSAAEAQTSEPALSQLVPLYTTDTAIFICPGSGDRALPGAEPFADRGCSYAYISGLKNDASANQSLASDVQVSAAAKTAGDPLFPATGRNHRGFGGNVLFADGHVETQDGSFAVHDFPLPAGIRLLNPKP